MKVIILSLFCLIFANSINAQWNQNMRMGQWNITIEANQFTAKTVMELQFCHDAQSGDAEAMYYFNLLPHQAITHFELMLGDKYRDGSIEERWKAVNTYNSIVGKRIDPAVLQKSYNNQYTLNIFPVAAGNCRKVRITIEEKLRIGKEALIYSLPIVSYKKVDQLNINFKSTNKLFAITKGLLKQANITEQGIQHTTKFENIRDSIYVEMYLQKKAICVSKKDSTYYLAYRNTELTGNHFFKPKNIAVFFDVSMASATSNINLQFDFLKKYLSENNISSFTAIAFNQEEVFKLLCNTDRLSGLKNRVLETKFSGASNLNIVASYKNFDGILLFSKGTSSYAAIEKIQTDIPIFAIVNDKEPYNINNLTKIVQPTGGSIIPIHKDRLGNAFAKTNFLQSKTKQVLINDQPTSFHVIDSSITDQEFIFLESNEPIHTMKIIQVSNDKETDVIFDKSSFCTTEHLDKIKILYDYQQLEKNRNQYYWHGYQYNDNYWARALSFGRKHKIITEQTAYLVLERIEDYINYGITPPKELEQKVINDPRYVQQKTRDPYQWDEANRLKQNLQTSIQYYNSYAYGTGTAQYKTKEQIALDKIKIEPVDIAYAGSDFRRGNSFSGNNESESKFDVSSKTADEVVVTGYGSSRKRDMASSVSIVTSKQLSFANTNQDLAYALAGRVPGLQVSSGSGTAGSGVSLSIRGASSFANSRHPLYVVDGLVVQGDLDVNHINPNDIESVTVLKDISASTLYGSRAANGAIVIQTKKGKYNTRPIWKKYNLYEMEDVDYITDLRNADPLEIWKMYVNFKKDFGHRVNFYMDVAEIFTAFNRKKEARDILLSALEISEVSNDILTVAYTLDDLGWHEDARNVYEMIAKKDILNSGYMHRNIAISYLLENKAQNAANHYYKAISEYANYNNYDNKNMLLEFNAVLEANKGKIDTSNFEIVFSKINLPIKHVAVENSYGSNNYINLKRAEGLNYYNNYHGKSKVYNFNSVENKSEELIMNCHGYNSDYMLFARVIEFDNFGLYNQKIKTKMHNLTGQYGEVVIQTIKY